MRTAEESVPGGGGRTCNGPIRRLAQSVLRSVPESTEGLIGDNVAGVADADEPVIRVGILLTETRALLAGAIAVALGLDPKIQVIRATSSIASRPIGLLAAAVDVLIIDTVSTVTQLRKEFPNLKVVVLGAAGDLGATLASVRGGAAAYVCETSTPDALADVIRRVHAGEAAYESSVLLALLQRPNLTPTPHHRRTARLSERELEVLRATAMGSSTTEAADTLGISLNTLRTHLKNILVKLEARSKLEAVIIAIREGRIQLPAESP
jgi:DNA-binding NarL/FixJ family response regulator